MGVLSDKQTMDAIVRDEVVIHPFDQKRLNTSSYDVRLGPWHFREQNPQLPKAIFNPFDPEHVAKVWGKPIMAGTLADETPTPMVGIEPTDQVIFLRPGETILGHTEEFIGTKRYATSMMKARSSAGRCFIAVCKCAGWGDVGYFNRWTMEITNFSTHYTLPLVVGMRIAQITFPTTGGIIGASYEKAGSYQSSDDLDTLVRNWKPEMMLPRMTK
jgi:dCTP deaminase